MTRYEIDEWMNEAARASDRERNDVAYDVVKNLYYAFSKTVGDDIASDILYTLAGSIIGSSGESELSYPVFDLLARAFGVRLSKSEFFDALVKHSSDREMNCLRRAIGSLNDNGKRDLVTFACMIYACDGRITQREKEFMYGLILG